MAQDVTDAELRALVSQGLSQRPMAQQTGIPRAALYRRVQRWGLTPEQPPVQCSL